MSNRFKTTLFGCLFSILTFGNTHCLAQNSTELPGRIYISKNQGLNWQPADHGFPQTGTVNDFTTKGSLVFAGTGTHGIYVSRDGLKNWQPASTGLPERVKVDAMLAVEGLILAGTNQHGIFISRDDGNFWQASNQGLNNLTVRCFFAFKSTILAGTNGGIYISEDNGKSWNRTLEMSQINGFTSLNGTIFAGINKGVLRSSDGGKTWESIFDQSTLHNISNDGRFLFAMTYDRGVMKKDNYGGDWEHANEGLPNLYTFQIVAVGRKLLAGQWTGIFVSEDEGNSWHPSNFGLPPGSAFKELFVTPYGIIAGAGLIKN